MKRLVHTSFIILLLIPQVALCLETEARLKTAFIYQFTKYIDWPTDSLADSFHITLVGSSALASPLNDLAQEKKIKDRQVSIHIVQSTEEIPPSRIIILSGQNEGMLDAILARIQSRPTLTITESHGFASRGAILNFYLTPEGKLRFEANRKAAEKQKLILSSQLLKMARLVGE